MSPPTFDQLVRRIIAATFDAGVVAAGRPPSTRNAAREDQVAYATTILAANLRAEAARLAADAAQEPA